MRFLLSLLLFVSFSCSALTVTVPDTFDTVNEDTWKDLSSQIVNTTDSEIFLFWKGYGGYIYLMEDFIKSIKTAKKQSKLVHFILIGNSYSAHAVTVCYATDIQNNDDYFLMLHPVAKGSKPINDPATIKASKILLKDCVDKDILTNSDVDKLMMINEIYVYYKNGKVYKKVYMLDSRL